MKRVLLSAALLIALQTPSYAADSSSGCGLGWMLLPKNSLVSSFTRTLINTTFLNTVGMTLGTSGCAKHSIVQQEQRSLHFVEANRDRLATEMALGQGEYLAAFADTLGCDWQAMAEFGKMAQSQYKEIVPSAATSAQDMLINVKMQMRATPALAATCGYII